MKKRRKSPRRCPLNRQQRLEWCIEWNCSRWRKCAFRVGNLTERKKKHVINANPQTKASHKSIGAVVAKYRRIYNKLGKAARDISQSIC